MKPTAEYALPAKHSSCTAVLMRNAWRFIIADGDKEWLPTSYMRNNLEYTLCMEGTR